MLQWQLEDLAEAIACELERLYGEPHGMCAQAALIVNTFALEAGLESRIVLGSWDDNHFSGPMNHAWVEVCGLIVDPTLRQFDENAARLVFPVGSNPHYRTCLPAWDGPSATAGRQETWRMLGEWDNTALAETFLDSSVSWLAQ